MQQTNESREITHTKIKNNNNSIQFKNLFHINIVGYSEQCKSYIMPTLLLQKTTTFNFLSPRMEISRRYFTDLT